MQNPHNLYIPPRLPKRLTNQSFIFTRFNIKPIPYHTSYHIIDNKGSQELIFKQTYISMIGVL